MKIFFSAGEASGDALGASLIEALQKRVSFEAYGMGGPRMAALGFRALRDAGELNVVGLVEVLRHLPRLYRLLWDLAERGVRERPDVAVLIDVPDFNVKLARYFRRAGIPVVFYVGPSVWAWRSSRVARFRRVVQRMLVLFPFETSIWRDAGVDTLCVGHPLADEIPAMRAPSQVEPRSVTLMPGSRRSEITRLLPVMAAASAELARRGLVEKFYLPIAPTISRALLEPYLQGLNVTLVEGVEARRAALARSAAAIVASGTATLETALVGTPQVIVYRASPLTWWIGKRLVRVKHLGLPNLIAGSEIVPELLQDNLQSAALADRVAALLHDASAQNAALAELRGVLGPNRAADLAADAILDLLKPSSSPAS